MMTKIKWRLLRLLPQRIVLMFSGLKFALTGDNLRLQRRVVDNERRLRMLSKRLLHSYEELSAVRPRAATINDFEASVYSQNGEDGILLHLFSLVGCDSHTFVEFGVGDGRECNTANLSLNLGWRGLLIEQNAEAAAEARRFYERQPGAKQSVRVRHDAVTAENINQILVEEGIQGEIDLLSIDIDGNDYWVWQAISVIQPRIVVIEYNASFGPHKALVSEDTETVPSRARHNSGYYHGASITALGRLAGRKGYILVGCESTGVNAFFVRQDLAGDKLAPVSPEQAYFPHFYRTRRMSQEDQWQFIADMPYHEV